MGWIHLYTGDGEGKSTAALGLALRAIGHGKKVIVIEFMKGRKDIGEFKVQNKLKPYYEIYQFGRKEFVDLKNPDVIDIDLARKGLNFAKQMLKKKPFLLILEEINLAVHIGLLRIEDVLQFLKEVPKETNVILTGRKAPRELIQVADLVTEMKEIKHPYYQGVEGRKGIDY